MGSVHIMFVDSPNTTDVVEYQLYYKVQNGSTVYRFSLNQTTRDSTGNYGSDEHSVSSIVLQEIAINCESILIMTSINVIGPLTEYYGNCAWSITGTHYDNLIWEEKTLSQNQPLKN